MKSFFLFPINHLELSVRRVEYAENTIYINLSMCVK